MFLSASEVTSVNARHEYVFREALDPRGSWLHPDELVVGADRVILRKHDLFSSSEIVVSSKDIRRFIISKRAVLPGSVKIVLVPENAADWVFGGKVKTFYFRKDATAAELGMALDEFLPHTEVIRKTSIM